MGCFCSARFCREKKADYAIVSSSNLEYVQFYTVCVQVYLGILNLICFQRGSTSIPQHRQFFEIDHPAKYIRVMICVSVAFLVLFADSDVNTWFH